MSTVLTSATHKLRLPFFLNDTDRPFKIISTSIPLFSSASSSFGMLNLHSPSKPGIMAALIPSLDLVPLESAD